MNQIPQNERLAIVETKVKAFEKAMEEIPGKFSNIIDKFDRVLSKHEEKIKDVVTSELRSYQEKIDELEGKLKQLDFIRFLAKYPKVAILIIIFLYLMAISDIREIVLKSLKIV